MFLPKKWAEEGACACVCRIYCSSLLTMDGCEFKGCTEGGRFRLVKLILKLQQCFVRWVVRSCNNIIVEGAPPQTSLVASAFHIASGWKLGGAWPGYEATRNHSVPTLCPGIGCVLATSLSLGLHILELLYCHSTRLGLCLPLLALACTSCTQLTPVWNNKTASAAAALETD